MIAAAAPEVLSFINTSVTGDGTSCLTKSGAGTNIYKDATAMALIEETTQFQVLPGTCRVHVSYTCGRHGGFIAEESHFSSGQLLIFLPWV